MVNPPSHNPLYRIVMSLLRKRDKNNSRKIKTAPPFTEVIVKDH